MKRKLLQCSLWLLLFFCWMPAAQAQLGSSGDKVVRIVITNSGPQVASEELVKAHIRVKVGDTWNPKRADEDLGDLYGTGFFANILIKPERTPEGGWIITYVLFGKMKLIGITFEGNGYYSESKLRKKVTSKIGSPVDEKTLFTDQVEIEKMYEKDGRYGTKVRYELINVDLASGSEGVLFKITEAPKVKIKEIVFTGATAFKQKKLRGEIKTSVRGMWSWISGSGYFKAEEFEEDPDRLRDFYQKEGYIDFQITATNITHPTPETMKIEFVVSEGSQYHVGKVTFKGNKLFTTEQIVAGLKQMHAAKRLKTKIGVNGMEADEGMIFKPEAHRTDVNAVEDFYGSKGYLDVRNPSDHLRVSTIANTETGTIDIEYQIDEGDKSYIEKIEIRGNIKTKDRVLRRELTVSPGDVFDMVQVEFSKHRLEGLDYFEKVEMVPETDPTLLNRKNLVVAVEEKPTANFSVGASYNTEQSISGFLKIEQVNFDMFNPPYFTGAGQKMRLYLQIGTEVQNYQLEWVEPWFLDRHLSLSVSAYRQVNKYDSQLYNEARTGLSLGLSTAVRNEFTIAGLTAGIEQVDIFDVSTNAPDTILKEQGSKLLPRFGASLIYDKRNDVRLPTKGTRTAFTTTLTTGDQSYVKFELSSAWYFRGLAEGHVLEVVAKGGVAQKIGSQDVPFYDRYYLGGLTTLRGYEYRGVGPREAWQDGSRYEPIGGDTFWMGSVEYSVPIIQFLRFAVFYDIGNVSAKPWSNQGFDVIGQAPEFLPGQPPGFTHFNAGNTGTFSDNFGFGIHLDIPRLPLRIDYGIPLHHDNFNGDNGKIQIGVGFTRPF